MTKTAVLYLVTLTIAFCAGAQTPLERAHSHNDYTRSRPLLDALELGVCSVEADIFCIDGQLLVAHDREEVHPERTLEALYLDPLLEKTRENGGPVYPGGPSFTLLIDFKDSGRKTYERLREVLQDYAEMLTLFEEDKTIAGAVTVIISGNRPTRSLAKESRRFAAIDGRLPDLDRPASPHLVPLISASWESAFTWRGDGEMPEEEREKLRGMVQRTHANGQRLRFWALPGRHRMWDELYNAGVDLINADDIARLQAFLLDRKAAKNS